MTGEDVVTGRSEVEERGLGMGERSGVSSLPTHKRFTTLLLSSVHEG